MDRPLILNINDAESDLVKAVNDIIRRYNLPCYFMELILDKIHNQIKEGAKLELGRAAELEKKAKADEERGEVE